MRPSRFPEEQIIGMLRRNSQEAARLSLYSGQGRSAARNAEVLAARLVSAKQNDDFLPVAKAMGISVRTWRQEAALPPCPVQATENDDAQERLYP